jgi:prolyl-tRNA editing enzyme YbaK/EbsC (Cys-tRNA(Pro) deacylase)
MQREILNFLKKSKVKFEIIPHKTVFTATDKAATLKVKPESVIKTLVIRANNNLFLALISANRILDLDKLKKMIERNFKMEKLKKIELATERLIKNKFKGVKVGSIPPFGNFWKMPVLVDNRIKKQRTLFFNSGEWNSSLKLSFSSLKKLSKDIIFGSFSKVKK